MLEKEEGRGGGRGAGRGGEKGEERREREKAGGQKLAVCENPQTNELLVPLSDSHCALTYEVPKQRN